MSTLPDSVSHPDETLNFAVLGTWGMQAIHLACLLPLWTGVSWRALIACGVSYCVRGAAITCGFHRCLSHRSFRTSRLFQFVLAWIATSAMQRGPLWWVAHHRRHHRYSDTEMDVHSPVARSFWWGHIGWILCRKHDDADLALVRDLAAFPEIRWLDRHFLVPPLALAVSLTGAGALISSADALQFLVWGFFVSTVLVYHGTFAVNSLAHRFGTRPFDTKDGSRNNLAVAVVMFGEGFHNNHHQARFSLQPGQIDLGYWLLRLREWRGLVWDLKAPPAPFQRAKPVRIDPAGRG
jgi:stearoyl-CoA desaturase (Delta-9 desaturase)